MGKYQSTKTYGHELGLSCCFRQWRAESHCRQLHGYALSFKIVFEADELDANNWVMDFGALKPIKHFLESQFDHTVAIAADDPKRELLEEMCFTHELGDATIMPAVGCEAFARHVARWVNAWLLDTPHAQRVRLVSVECREHGANSALYIEDNDGF